MGYFSSREMMEHHLCLRQQLLKVEMGKGKRLNMDVKVFLGRKNEVVSKLDFALEVLATAFGVELKPVLMYEMGFVLMLMLQAMRASLRWHNTKTARQVMVFGAIVELHVPTH